MNVWCFNYSGKITYYTHPPDQHSLPSHVDAQVVAKMSEAFNIDDIKMDEEKILQGTLPHYHTVFGLWVIRFYKVAV